LVFKSAPLNLPFVIQRGAFFIPLIYWATIKEQPYLREEKKQSEK